MAIGQNVLEIGARSDGGNDFVLGETTSIDTDDGGFSPETVGINPTYQEGIFNPPATFTDKSTNLTDEIIASAADPTYLGTPSGNEMNFLDASSAFYNWDGSSLTKKVTSSSTFRLGTTDFISWQDTANGLNYYATTQAGSGGDIVKWNGNVTLTETWWTGAGTLNQSALSSVTAWRPLLVFETFMYVGDKNKLHRIDIGLTVSNGILTLAGNESISALGVDNGSGKILIATTTGVDYNASRNGESKIYYYDGYSNKALKVCAVNGTITSFLSLGNDVFVFYGNKIGLFTGSGIQYLATLGFALGTPEKLIYKHRRSVIDNTIYIAENYTILAYGEVIPGRKVFYRLIRPSAPGSNNFTCLTNIGAGKLGVSFAASKFYTFDTTSVSPMTGDGTCVFYSKKYKFPRPIWVRSIIVEYKTDITTGSGAVGAVALIDDTSTATNTSISQISTTQSFFQTPALDVKTRIVQIRYVYSPDSLTPIFGVKRILVYWDTAE